jgi:hypothetical protein
MDKSCWLVNSDKVIRIGDSVNITIENPAGNLTKTVKIARLSQKMVWYIDTDGGTYSASKELMLTRMGVV